jgi:hypothetical protein
MLIAKDSFAQYPGMRQVYQQQSMQLAQQQSNMFRSMTFNNRIGNLYNFKYKFQVVLKDSTKIEVKSKIYTDTLLHKNYLLIGKDVTANTHVFRQDTKIYPGQTFNISRKDGNDDIIGSPTDSCWMFRAIVGKITAYSYLSGQDQDFDPVSIIAIQYNNGPIISYSAENLKKMIIDDNDAMKYFTDKKYDKAITRYNKNAKKAAKK